MKNDTGTAGDEFYRVWGKFWVGVVAKRSGAKLSKAKRSGVLERDFTGGGEFRGGRPVRSGTKTRPPPIIKNDPS